MPTLVYRAFCPEWGLASVQAFSPVGLCMRRLPAGHHCAVWFLLRLGFLGRLCAFDHLCKQPVLSCETPEGHGRHSRPFVCSIQADMKGGDVKNPFQTRAGKHTHDLFSLNTVTKPGTATHTGSRSGRKRARSLAEELNGEEKNDLSRQLDSVNRFLTDLYTHLPVQMFKPRRI